MSDTQDFNNVALSSTSFHYNDLKTIRQLVFTFLSRQSHSTRPEDLVWSHEVGSTHAPFSLHRFAHKDPKGEIPIVESKGFAGTVAFFRLQEEVEGTSKKFAFKKNGGRPENTELEYFVTGFLEPLFAQDPTVRVVKPHDYKEHMLMTQFVRGLPLNELIELRPLHYQEALGITRTILPISEKLSTVIEYEENKLEGGMSFKQYVPLHQTSSLMEKLPENAYANREEVHLKYHTYRLLNSLKLEDQAKILMIKNAMRPLERSIALDPYTVWQSNDHASNRLVAPLNQTKPITEIHEDPVTLTYRCDFNNITRGPLGWELGLMLESLCLFTDEDIFPGVINIANGVLLEHYLSCNNIYKEGRREHLEEKLKHIQEDAPREMVSFDQELDDVTFASFLLANHASLTTRVLLSAFRVAEKGDSQRAYQAVRTIPKLNAYLGQLYDAASQYDPFASLLKSSRIERAENGLFSHGYPCFLAEKRIEAILTTPEVIQDKGTKTHF